MAADVRSARAWVLLACMAVIAAGLTSDATAAPSATARSALVPFKNSPFPFDGRPMPGQDKPFFDVEKDGRRGHTSARGGVYWEDTTYADRRVLLYIPQGFDPARPGLMIVYFHGNLATLERDVRDRQQVPRQVAQSGLNAVLVAPQLAVDALDSTAGRLHEPGHFRRFVEEACAQLAKLHGDRRASRAIDMLPVVIVAYSGGYYPAAWALHHGGLGDRLRGVILLDGLYSDYDKFVAWIAARAAGFFFSAYSRSAREENGMLQRLLSERNVDFATALPTRIAAGSVAFLAAGDDVQHHDFVTNAWVPDPLKAVLARIVDFPRTKPPARARQR
jgi:hypothetical protein